MGEAALHGIKVHEALENRIANGTPLPKHLRKFESTCAFLSEDGDVQVEREMTLTDDLTPTDWTAPDAWLRSKLDILVVKGANALVMDWKTGKRRMDMFQLRLFAAQVFRHYPEVKRVSTSLVWLRDGIIDTEVIEREEYNSIMADILHRIKRIYDAYEEATWPARPSGLCNYCPAKHDCEYA